MATLAQRLQAEIDRANATTSKTDTTVHNAVGSLIDGYGQGSSENVTWNQCPEAPRNFVNNVTYDPNDYSTSQIENYAPATALESNTKPIAETVTGDEHRNEVPNIKTPFANATMSGTLKPLDQLRWFNTTVATISPYPLGVNTRDLGGWACDGGKVKYGMLVRGGEPNEVDKDLMVNQVGIRTELQLLPKSESRHTYSAWGIDFFANPEEATSVAYSLSPKSLWKFYLQVVFDSVSHSKPLYFHCGIGADRTGTIAIMLEALLGVSQSDIDKDYELTNFYVRDPSFPRRRNVNMYKNYIAEIKNFPLVGGLIDTFANHAISFAVSLGFTADEINAYRNACIDGTPTQITLNLPTYTITNNLTDVVNSNTDTSITQYQDYIADLTVANSYVISDVQIKLNDTDVTDLYFTGTKTTLNYSIQKNLTNCHLNGKNTVIAGQSYVAELIADTGFTMDGATITISMGGIDMSNYYSNGKIAIPNVTGNIIITATAISSTPTYTNLADPNSPDWLIDKRLNSSGQPVDSTGKTCTNGIECTNGDIIYVKGTSTFSLTTTNDRIALFINNITENAPYCDYGAVWLNNAEDNIHGYMRKLGDGYYAIHINQSTTKIKYIRMCFNTPEDSSSVIITKNEEIT